jgi:hypothetical protein
MTHCDRSHPSYSHYYDEIECSIFSDDAIHAPGLLEWLLVLCSYFCFPWSRYVTIHRKFRIFPEKEMNK